MERAVADIDLEAVAGNVERLRRAAPGSGFMAVVKADGYGHGMIPVARACREAGAEYLGVALPVEAMQLRGSGDTGRVMCWLYTPGDDLTGCVAQGVDISVASRAMLDHVLAAVAATGTRARIHLKVDTGLGRNGAPITLWPDLVMAAVKARDARLVDIVGVWSHLASADDRGSGVTEFQVAQFQQALDLAHGAGLRDPVRHLASSAGVLAHPATHMDLVRCGISTYGLSPGPGLGDSQDLRLVPAMTVRATVALVKEVPAGQGVSYGLRYHTRERTRLALVPVGYADGLPRAGSGKLPIAVGGQQYTVAGTIAMDQAVLDVGEADVSAGDEVVLFGTGDDGEPTADDWAKACGTINYEIVTRLGTRIPRRYSGTDATGSGGLG